VNYNEAIEELKSLSNPDAVKGMAKYGINSANTYGISIPNLRKMAKKGGINHTLAIQLWESGIHEARILASMIDDLKLVTEEQLEVWVNDFDSWDICDECCMNLIERTEFAYRKSIEWGSNNKEFVKRAGFVMMARLAVSDKEANDNKFEPFFSLIKREANDDRNFVKKAVNWALRQIGKRNLNLNRRAIQIARDIRMIDSRSARWIAVDAIRELTSSAVQSRLKLVK
jgi:3-methyladenine DNA glycosylase AlkD